MTTNAEVGQAWKAGRRAMSLNMSTDGSLIHSYALIVGVTMKDGRKVCIDHTTRGGCFHSVTTSKQISTSVMPYASLLLSPNEYALFISHNDLQITDTLDWAARYSESKGW